MKYLYYIYGSLLILLFAYATYAGVVAYGHPFVLWQYQLGLLIAGVFIIWLGKKGKTNWLGTAGLLFTPVAFFLILPHIPRCFNLPDDLPCESRGFGRLLFVCAISVILLIISLFIKPKQMNQNGRT